MSPIIKLRILFSESILRMGRFAVSPVMDISRSWWFRFDICYSVVIRFGLFKVYGVLVPELSNVSIIEIWKVAAQH